MREPTMPNAYPHAPLDAPAPSSEGLLEDLAAAGVTYSVATIDRAEHARDWWPPLIADVARGHVERWPGVVVRANSTDDVVATLRVASAHGVSVCPQGGRSGVGGGAVPSAGAIALDLTGLNCVVTLDETSSTVRVQAGVFGPDLEAATRARGFTVGHFPQSFDLATVGGWIACRGAGQYSNRYGKIEDLVRGLTVVTARGEVMHLGGHGPRQAVGPDLVALFVGSEGTLGVITEATLVMRALPSCERRAAFSFATFDEGMTACRTIVQRDARPAVLRLYDEVETKRNFEAEGCALIVLDEGEEPFVEATMAAVRAACAVAVPLDESMVAHWLDRRNDVSALAPLWERGLVVDTIEVAGPWSILEDLRARVTAALLAREGMLVASAHQSHAYLDGACLYFTFAGLPTSDVASFYRDAWDVAMEEVIALGGAISHHHGIGRNRARFVHSALGDAFDVVVALKAHLDPMNILNPGVLGLGGPAW
jgi:alkyldihydroxyacetonephosphate synthase